MSNSIYVLGNGSSLRGFDFHSLLGYDTLGMNLAFRHWHRINWYPTYYACLDTVMIKEHGQAIRELIFTHGHHFRGYFLRRNILETYPELESFSEIQFLEDYRSEPVFEALWEHITTGSFSVLYAALRGYRNINLLGIDLNQVQCIPEARPVKGHVLEIYKTPIHNPNYFIDDYQRVGERFNIPDSKPNLHQNSWRVVATRLAEMEVNVVNRSPGSRLTLFPYEPFAAEEKSPKKVSCEPTASRSLCVTFFGINTSAGFSGGRYHAWMMAEAAAERGFEVHYVTNHFPSFYSDFDDATLFSKHRSIHVHLVNITEGKCVLPRIASDVVVVIPHQNCHGPFAHNAIQMAAQSGARLVLLNFESPNWFNELSPVKRPESAWSGWQDLAQMSSMIISLAEESNRYASCYYNVPRDFAGFKSCWAPINTRVADTIADIPREKRILVFARFAHAEHKGFDHLYDLLIPEMGGYTLTLVVGVGKPEPEAFSRIEEKALRLGIQIELQYCISEREKWRELKRSVLLIFLSYFEGFGLPPVEARYAGTPCACFNLPVLREVSGDELYYAPLGDITALAIRIRSILTTQSLQPAGKGPAVLRFEDFGDRVDLLLREAASATPIDIKGAMPKFQSESAVANLLLGKDCKPLTTLAGFSEASIDANGLLVVRGWSLAPRQVDRIRVFIDGKEVGLATLGISRTDIHEKYPEYSNAKAGFILNAEIEKPSQIKKTLCEIECYSGADLLKTIKRPLSFRQPAVELPTPILTTTPSGLSKADWGTWVEFGLDREALAQSQKLALICAHFQPYPVTQGNRVVFAQGLRVLRDAGYKVVLVLQFPVAAIESMLENLAPMADGVCAIEPSITADAVTHRRSRIDYYHPHTEQCVQHWMSLFHVKAVIAHYAHMAFVFRGLSSSVRKLVITHDVLHRLTTLGLPIDPSRTCTADEETELLRLADTVVAINEYERRLLERMLPDRNVITVGIAKLDLPFSSSFSGDRLRVLYTGSGNPMNSDGLIWFLREVWPAVSKEVPSATFAIAGQVCNTVPDDLKDLDGVEFLGVVDDLNHEFERADVVANCTRFGTGLKIKSIEALCRGKVLVSTSNGVEGIPYSGIAPFVVADDPTKFAESLVWLLTHLSVRRELELQARRYATTVLSVDAVYAPLLATLHGNISEKMMVNDPVARGSSKLPRIVLLTPHVPVPPDRGNRQRVNALWRSLSKHAAVSVGVLDDRGTYESRTVLRQQSVRFFPRRRSLDRYLRRDPSSIKHLRPGLWETGHLAESLGEHSNLWDVLSTSDAFTRHVLNDRRVARIQAWLRSIAPQVVVVEDTALASLIPAVKALGIRVIADMQNIDSLLYADIARSAGVTHHGRWLSAFSEAYADSERRFLHLADEVWTCSEDDRTWAKQELNLTNVRTMPNVVPVGKPLPPSMEPNLVYIGQLSYKPNEDAAIYLIELSKRLAIKNIKHHLHLVGKANDRILQAASTAPKTVTVHGVVPDLRPILASAAVIPVPLRTGGGTRIKILEAMAAGRAVVSTSVGIEGINYENCTHCIVTDDDICFEEEIVRLLSNADLRNNLGRNAREWVQSNYSLQCMEGLIANSLDWLLQSTPEWFRGALEPVWSEVWFNPFTKLLKAVFKYPLSEDIIDGRVYSLANSEPLHNVSVTLQAENKYLMVDVTAVLPATLQPEDVYLNLMTPRGTIRFAQFGKYKREHGGLLTFEPLENGLFRAMAWSDPAEDIPSLKIRNVLFDPVSERLLNKSGMRVHEYSGAIVGEPLQLRDKVNLTKGTEGSLATFFLPPGFAEAQSKMGSDLRRFKNIHAGKRAWLIGNGPSVRTSDLDLLTNEITFCFNRFYLAHPSTKLRASYTVSGDRQMIEDFGEEIAKQAAGEVFFANDEPPNINETHHWLPQIPCYPPLFSFSPGNFVSPGGSSLYVAMQLAYYMGIRELLIYGADFKFTWQRSRVAEDKFRTAVGDGNHFIPNYRSGAAWCPPSFKDIAGSFSIARFMYECSGGYIVNVSRQSYLEIFETNSFSLRGCSEKYN